MSSDDEFENRVAAKLKEIQKYIASFDDPDEARFDLQLVVAMRNSEFEPGKLERTILDIYKELVNGRDVLATWNFPEESEGFDIQELTQHLSWY